MALRLWIVFFLSAFCQADYLIRTRKLGEQVSDKIPLIVATTLIPPFVIPQDGGSYTGFVPELIASLGQNYSYYVKSDSTVGGFANNTWTGIVGDTAHLRAAHMAMGPIMDNAETTYFRSVDFSRPLLPVAVRLVINKLSPISSLEDALEHQASFILVAGSVEENSLTQRKNLSQLLTTLQTQLTNATRVENVEEGLKVASTENNSVLILNSLDVYYNLGKIPCGVIEHTVLPGSIMPLGSYSVAVSRAFKHYKAGLDSAIEALEADSKLSSLANKWWNGMDVCSSGWVSRNFIFTTDFVALILLTIVSGYVSR